MPFPLQHAPMTAGTQEHYQHMREAALDARALLDGDLQHTVELLLTPEVRVESAGVVHNDDGARPIRSLAALRGQRAAVVVQETADGGVPGDIAVLATSTPEALRELLRQLPEAPAGRTTGARGASTDRCVGTSAVLRTAHRQSQPEKLRSFMSKPATASGAITAYRGGAYDNRSARGCGFLWRDLADDGRYLIQRGQTISVIPGTPQRLAEELNAVCAQARRHTAGALLRL
jgi:hypothetical protein